MDLHRFGLSLLHPGALLLLQIETGSGCLQICWSIRRISLHHSPRAYHPNYLCCGYLGRLTSSDGLLGLCC